MIQLLVQPLHFVAGGTCATLKPGFVMAPKDVLDGLDERHCTAGGVRKLEDIFKDLMSNLVIIQECKNGFKCGNEGLLSQWVCDGEQDCAD